MERLTQDLDQQDHSFGQDQVRPGERRTQVVILLTAITMVIEIVAGMGYGSMALLADGLHMASHTAALSITAFAYIYARRHARDARFSFGTGKVNALGGYSGAVLLALFALFMGGESMHRLIRPAAIAYDQAILVAVLGLIVNGVSVWILGGKGHAHHTDHAHAADAPHHEHGGRHDHNLRSAYLHVLADAVTSVLAIAALYSGKVLGWAFMDPAMGMVGAVLVARWSWGLLIATSRVLLDAQAAPETQAAVRVALEQDGHTRVIDLHIWAIGPGLNAAAVTVVTSQLTGPDAFRQRLPVDARIVHAHIEVHRARV